jgi:Mn2+/Fe2+ NRAMP family transporter
MNSSQSPPQPIAGMVFGMSVIRTLVLVVLSMLLLFLGAFLVWAKVTDQVLDPHTVPRKVTWWGLVVGVLMVLIATIMIVVLLWGLWGRHRLVIGADRLQMITRLRGEDTVVL